MLCTQTETKDANHRTYLVRGRPTGVRKQLFAIPADVLLDKVTAGLDKGVLKVSVVDECTTSSATCIASLLRPAPRQIGL